MKKWNPNLLDLDGPAQIWAKAIDKKLFDTPEEFEEYIKKHIPNVKEWKKFHMWKHREPFEYIEWETKAREKKRAEESAREWKEMQHNQNSWEYMSNEFKKQAQQAIEDGWFIW